MPNPALQNLDSLNQYLNSIYYSSLRIDYVDPDTRDANIWWFFSGNNTGGTGASGNNDPCNKKQSGAFAYYGSFIGQTFATVSIKEIL